MCLCTVLHLYRSIYILHENAVGRHLVETYGFCVTACNGGGDGHDETVTRSVDSARQCVALGVAKSITLLDSQRGCRPRKT